MSGAAYAAQDNYKANKVQDYKCTAYAEQPIAATAVSFS
jgi:hypothetical protein